MNFTISNLALEYVTRNEIEYNVEGDSYERLICLKIDTNQTKLMRIEKNPKSKKILLGIPLN